jgi:NADPH:quinone reductase-like Zn-dependent oxidoreductase
LIEKRFVRAEERQMRAFTLDGFESTPGLRDDEFPVTLGRDFAGVLEEVGSGVSRYEVGDAVFGFVLHANPAVHEGSWADYVVIAEDSVARAPQGLSLEAVGAAPVAGLTAIAAFDALEPSDGDTVLVIGASGGVGSFFVQLARKAGAHIVAPALPEDTDYLRELGVGETLDRDSDLAVQVRERFPAGVDAALDLVSFTPDASILKEGGRLASPLGAAGEGPGRTNLMASGTTANLERLAELLGVGSLRVHVRGTFELEQAGEALQSLASSHTQGKVAIAIA